MKKTEIIGGKFIDSITTNIFKRMDQNTAVADAYNHLRHQRNLSTGALQAYFKVRRVKRTLNERPFIIIHNIVKTDIVLLSLDD